MCDKSRNTWLCVHWQWNTLEWCQLNALQASPVVHLVTPLECVSLSMNTQPSVPAIETPDMFVNPMFMLSRPFRQFQQSSLQWGTSNQILKCWVVVSGAETVPTRTKNPKSSCKWSGYNDLLCQFREKYAKTKSQAEVLVSTLIDHSNKPILFTKQKKHVPLGVCCNLVKPCWDNSSV